jgi:hypothetical protein
VHGRLDPADHRPHRRFACARNQAAPQASTRHPLAESDVVPNEGRPVAVGARSSRSPTAFAVCRCLNSHHSSCPLPIRYVLAQAGAPAWCPCHLGVGFLSSRLHGDSHLLFSAHAGRTLLAMLAVRRRLRVAPRARLRSAARDGDAFARAMGEGCLRRGLQARSAPRGDAMEDGWRASRWRAPHDIACSSS